MPEDAALAVGVERIDALDIAVAELLIEAELATLSTPQQILNVIGVGRGIDMGGSMAIALFPPGEPGGEVRPLFVAPVRGPERLLEDLRAGAEQGGLRFFQFNRRQYAARALDGSLAVSADAELLRGRDAAGGVNERRAALLGPRGAQVVDGAAGDLLVVMHPAPLLELIERTSLPAELEGLEGLPEEDAAEARRMVAEGRERLLALSRQLAGQTDILVGRVAPDGRGLRGQLAAVFTPGTAMAAACDGGAVEPSPLALLPEGPYLVAAGIDASSTAARDLLAELWQEPGLAEGPGAIEVGAVAVYAPDPQRGVFEVPPSLVRWRSAEDAEVFVTAAQKVVATRGRATLVWTADAGEFGGRRISAWSLLPRGGNGERSLASGLAMLEGATGSLVAPGDRMRLAKASVHDVGEDASIAEQRMVAGLRRFLPTSSGIEVYVDPQPALRVLAPLLGGRGIQVQVPDRAAPASLGVAFADGALHAAGYLPPWILRLGYELAASGGAAPR